MPLDSALHWPLDRAFCELANALLTKPDWIFRRVESIDLWLPEGDRRHVSIDIDTKRLKEIADDVNFSGSTILVPLGWYKKELMLDFSVTGPDGQPLSLLTSDGDSAFAQASLLGLLHNTLGQTQVSDPIQEHLYQICHDFPKRHDAEIVESIGKTQDTSAAPDSWSIPSATPEITREWNRLVALKDFRSRLESLTISFLPTVSVDLGRDSMIVKFDLLTASRAGHPTKDSRMPNLGLAKTLGLVDRLLSVEISGEFEGQREHLRVQMPPGIEIASSPYIEAPTKKASEELNKTAQQGRTSGDRILVYRKEPPREVKKYYLTFGARPSMDGFAGTALAGLLAGALTFAFLLAAHYFSKTCWDRVFREGMLFDSIISFLVLGSGLVSGYSIAQDKEFARRRMLKALRRVVGGAACTSMLVGLLTIVFAANANAWPTIISAWWLALIIGLVASGLVLAASVKTMRSAKRVSKWKGETLTVPVIASRQNKPGRFAQLLAWLYS